MTRSTLLVLALLATQVDAQLAVTGVEPAGAALGVSTATEVRVTFDAALDAATVDTASVRVFGRWSGVVDGTVSVVGTGDELLFQPSRPFFPGEMVTLMISSAVESSGGDPLAGGFTSGFWTRSRSNSSVFALEETLEVRVDGEVFIQAYGAYAGDLDRDGAPDLTIPNETSGDVRILHNDGCGSFAAPEIYVLPLDSVPSSNEGQDFDGDGWIDFATANQGGDTTTVLLNDGAGSFLPATTSPSGTTPRGLVTLDVEGDGDIDLAIASRFSSNIALHRGNGDGTFAAPTFFEGGGAAETSLAAVDANGDGLFDLYAGHHDSQNVTSLLGDGTGAFVVTDDVAAGGRPWMMAHGDVDADGVVDAAWCNSNTGGAGVSTGDGSGGLSAADLYPGGSFSLAIDLGDLDADGDLDLIVSSFGSGDYRVLRNDGTGAFAPVATFDANIAGSCAIVVDYDRDGDMDLVGIDELADEVFLFEHTDGALAGVQPSTCAAALRVNNLAGSAGYGGSAAHAIGLGDTLFLGFTGVESSAYAYAFGPLLDPGVATGYGVLNLNPLFVLGSGALDSDGEALVGAPVPLSLTPGLTFGLQAWVADPGHPAGGSFTNPEAVLLVP